MIEFIIALWITLFGYAPTAPQHHHTTDGVIYAFDATGREIIIISK